MNILPNVTAVHVVSPEQGFKPKISPDSADVKVISSSSDRNGGIWVDIAQLWLAARTRYVCYVPPYHASVTGRFKEQTAFMELHDLAASYCDIAIVDVESKPCGSVSYPDFTVDMVGTPYMPMETMLIDRNKFLESGGFDYFMAGCFDPVRYIGTMLACSGRIMHLKKELVAIDSSIPSIKIVAEREFSFKSEDFRDMQRRFGMDRWVSKARSYYRSMKWM